MWKRNFLYRFNTWILTSEIFIKTLEFFTIWLSLFLWIGPVFAGKGIPPIIKEYIYREQNLNNHYARIGHQVKTQLLPEYSPQEGKSFEIPYLELPLDEIKKIDLGQLQPKIARQLIFERDGKKYFKFFIHPQSTKLYEPWIAKFGGIKGHFMATATSSGRTLVVWNHKLKNPHPFMVKGSMDIMQFGFGRGVDQWELEKSVHLSKELGQIPKKDLKKHKIGFMNESYGVHPTISDNIKSLYFTTDEHNPKLYKMLNGSTTNPEEIKKLGLAEGEYHAVEGNSYNEINGLIIREMDLDSPEWKSKQIYPLFSIFAEDEKLKKKKNVQNVPLIAKMWKASGLEWEKFLKENILRPLIHGVGYLTMGQGIFLHTHTQNMLVQVNHEKNRIEKVLFRDFEGSATVDVHHRIGNKLDIAHLTTTHPKHDFYMNKDPNPFNNVFNLILPYGFKPETKKVDNTVLPKHIPGYDYKRIWKIAQEVLIEETKNFYGKNVFDNDKNTPVEGRSKEFKNARHKYLKSLDPKFAPSKKLSPDMKRTLQLFVNKQKEKFQVYTLNYFTFDKSFKDNDLLITKNGIIFKVPSRPFPRIALFSKEFPNLESIVEKFKDQVAAADALNSADACNGSETEAQQQQLLKAIISGSIKTADEYTRKINALIVENNELLNNSSAVQEAKNKIVENKKHIKNLRKEREEVRAYLRKIKEQKRSLNARD